MSIQSHFWLEFPFAKSGKDASPTGQTIAVEVETGKSNTKENLNKIKHAGFDKIVLVATSPAAFSACQKAVDVGKRGQQSAVELTSWLDV